VGQTACDHQYCPPDRCTEGEGLRACRHPGCPWHRCLRLRAGEQIHDLGLPRRVVNQLTQAGIGTVEELVRKRPHELLLLRNCGPATLFEVLRALQSRGLHLEPSQLSELQGLGSLVSEREIQIILRATS